MTEKAPKPAPPLHWPSIADDPREAQDVLTVWVQELVERFAIRSEVVPDCWNRHNGIIEALQALRDFERGAYDPGAEPTQALGFLRAMTDVLELCRTWVSLTGCSSRHKETVALRIFVTDPAGWVDVDRAPATWHVVPA